MPSPSAISPFDVVQSGLCIGCGSCVAQASPEQSCQMQWDQFGQLQPAGSAEWFRTASEPLSRTCPFSPAAPNEDQLGADLFPANAPHPELGRYQSAYVGYVAEDGFRDRGSSGGMVSWVLAELLRHDLVDQVAHVEPVAEPHAEGRFYRYRFSRTPDEVADGAKSRYYPVELSEVLRHIRDTPGRYAIVGVPCFIKAIQLLRREDSALRERIRFTLGLFCGHMKSAGFAESFAIQMEVPTAAVRRVEYRLKDVTRPASTYTAELTLADGGSVRRDWWNLADGDWGAGFFQYSACNFCDDVVAETADISFGDAWVEPYSSDGRGTNVVVIRSDAAQALFDRGVREERLQAEPVDAEFIVQTQAAGFRQRREGLAYRLTWPRLGLRPQKRVTPSSDLPKKRKLIYRMRAHISRWSPRVLRFARVLRLPRLYVLWARCALALYHGLAYSRGRIGSWLARFRLTES